MQFPWMMYRKGPGLPLPHGESVSCQAASDETEFAAALKAGWFPSVPEALAEPAPGEQGDGATATGDNRPRPASDPRSGYEILSSLTDEQLFAEAKERNVSMEGSRKDLIDRIWVAAGYIVPEETQPGAPADE